MIGLNAEHSSSQTTPRANSAEFQRRTDAGSPLFGAETPSTICSESPVNVEPEDDVAETPTRGDGQKFGDEGQKFGDEGQKFGDEGHVHNLEESVEDEESVEGKRRFGLDAEREGREKENVEEEDTDAEREEGEKEDVEEEDAEEEEDTEEEDMDKDDEVTDRKETDGIETIWRLSAGANRQGLQSSMAGHGEPSNFNWHKQNTDTATRKGQDRDVTSAGQGHVKNDDLELGVDDNIMAHLDETLQFLRETRTPRLPTRFSRMTGGRLQDTGSLDGSRSQETSLHVNEDGKRPSVSASEPAYRLHDNEHSFGEGSSLPLDLNSVSQQRIVDVVKIRQLNASSGNITRDTNGKFSNNGQNLTDEMNLKTVLLDRRQTDIIPSERDTQPNENLSGSIRLGSGHGDNSLNASLKQKQELPHQSTKTLDVSQNSNSSTDIDSLILRYQNLRLQQTADTSVLVSANECHREVALSISSTSATAVRDDACTQVSRHSHTAEDGRVSLSHFDSAPPKDSIFGRDLTSEAKVEDLDKENFDDVRCLLLETSLTSATPKPRSSNRLSTSLNALSSRSANHLSASFCDHLEPSPFTDAVHSTEVSFLDDSTINLLGRSS